MKAPARVLLVDNYDSFTYNLVQAFQLLGADVRVLRNDEVGPAALAETDATHLVISPGPGHPSDAGASVEMIRAASGRVPVLGVCLGHQAIAVAHGLEVGRAQRLMHGKTSRVYHDHRTLFEGLPNPFEAGRYHSLAVSEPPTASGLVISAYTSDGEVMGIRHAELPIEGVQFHPESVLTPDGERLLKNFLDQADG
ncbi:MAG: aminodeoxychorismate/anthranilate synthase component II [Gemmatimonadota bacterium]